MIVSKDDSQDKFSRKADRNMNKKEKYVPLMERRFNDLISLKDQLKWLELKRKEKQKEKDKKQ